MKLCRALGYAKCIQKNFFSSSSASQRDLYNPSDEHFLLRKSAQSFVQEYVEPQAHDFNKQEIMNVGLLRKLGDLGLLGITVSSEFGGSGK